MDNPNIVDNISQWWAPDRGRVKVNCDVAVKGDGTDAKVSVTIRDWKGSLINGMVGSVKISSSLQGELLAICQGCGMIKDLGMMEGLVELDNQLAIKLSVSELIPPWEVLAVVGDIRQMKDELGISFGWVKRSVC